MTFEELDAVDSGSHHSEPKEARWASKYRENLVERYGERGKSVIFAEAFECSEYGAKLNDNNRKVLFPF